MALAVDQSKALNGGVSFLGTFAFANLPAAASWTGYTAFASDLGSGTILLYSNGTRWVPLGGRAVLKVAGASANIGSSETVVAQTLIPAGFLAAGDILSALALASKSGATDIGNVGLRMGTAGTTSDALLTPSFQNFMTATMRTGSSALECQVVSTTSVQRAGPASGFGIFANGSNNAAPVAVAISSAASNALYVSLTLASAGATDTLALQHGRIEVITG